MEKKFITIKLTQAEETMFNFLFQNPLFKLIFLSMEEEEQTAFISFLDKLSDEVHKAGWCKANNCPHRN